MAKEIEPALSREEWAVRRIRRLLPGADPQFERNYERIVIDSEFGDGVFVSGSSDPYELALISPATVPALMALANAALPDGHPNKLTPHDVWVARALLRSAYIDTQHPGGLTFKHDAERLAAKLAALLPPEPKN